VRDDRDSDTAGENELRLTDAYWLAANYLSVAQIYLLDNPLLHLNEFLTTTPGSSGWSRRQSETTRPAAKAEAGGGASGHQKMATAPPHPPPADKRQGRRPTRRGLATVIEVSP
jgi:hypothetical protein